jgi:hypothetical protein
MNKVEIVPLLHRVEHFNSRTLTQMLRKLSGRGLTLDALYCTVQRSILGRLGVDFLESGVAAAISGDLIYENPFVGRHVYSANSASLNT